MKKNLFFIIAFVAVCFISCEEDDNNPLKNSHRIKEIINNFSEENEGYKAVFTYTDEKINEVLEYYYESGLGWTLDYKSTIEYTDDDFVMFDYYYNIDSWELSSKYEFNFTDGLLIEVIHYYYEGVFEPCHKEIFTYSGKNIIKSEYFYFEQPTWLLDEKTELIYTDGRVSEIKAYYLEGIDQFVQYDKETFTYEDNKLKEWIDYYEEDTSWEYSYKYVYTYSGNLVSKTDCFYYYDNWVLDETFSFTYNENDYLTQVNSTDNVSTYTYEEGNGNYSKFMNPARMVYNNPSPKNTEKQSTFVKGVLDKYSFRKNN